ncbi:hypothetical protein G7066_14820 [Leucobacter coleopterorum]|uniref:Uncharacterized protein n=1 Tax=Leucobacter coleopterorum TaxID=2714933 RepID=A0ABX6JZ85_9MICO|nr:hypothetical protein [Leucobacter coleopterorum]QIM19533.1 hypothetical protein G7066_14820 [Leucobacter coleopterorum]
MSKRSLTLVGAAAVVALTLTACAGNGAEGVTPNLAERPSSVLTAQAWPPQQNPARSPLPM